MAEPEASAVRLSQPMTRGEVLYPDAAAWVVGFSGVLAAGLVEAQAAGSFCGRRVLGRRQRQRRRPSRPGVRRRRRSLRPWLGLGAAVEVFGMSGLG